MNKFLKVGLVCAAWFGAVGLAQATTLTPTVTFKGNTTWQNIGGVSYVFKDSNQDSLLEVGETVTFTIDMQKQYWGTHSFDALKVWIGNDLVETGKWFYDPSQENTKWYGKHGDTYSYRPWTGGDRTFSFDYTFKSAGTFDLLASVMCSRDLSWRDGGAADDRPTQADWDAWSKNIHQNNSSLQGEDKTYQLTVLAAPVPEPESYAMLLAGLGLMSAVARRRKAGQ